MMGRATLSLLLLLLFVSASSSQALGGATLQGLTAVLGDFAARPYRSVSSQTDDNVLLCPPVVSSGIDALVMAGSDGSTTKQELLQGLGLTGPDAQNVSNALESCGVMMGRATFSLPLLLLFVSASSSQEPDGAALQGLTAGLGDFAARLYRSVSGQTDDNVLLCPLVVSSGIAALVAGSDGSTKQELLQGLGLMGPDAQNAPALFQSLRDAVSSSGAFPLRQGVAVLPSQPSAVSPAYQDAVRGPYGGTAQTLTYSSPSDAGSTVNTWARGQTADGVKEMVQTPLDPQTKLLLATVAFYQSSLPFNASLTQDERFYVDKYHIKMVPMMFRSDKFHLAYDRLLKLGVLRLPMTDGAAMLVLLPDENVELSSVEEQVTYEQVQGWLRQLKKTKLEVQLPRFQLEQSYDLGSVLQKLGISEVFQDSADLSGIGGDTTLKLTQVIQRAVINVDESGSAEGGASGVFSSLPPRLTVNRPFLFLIYHQQTSSILYMGRVVDPTQK